MAKKIEDQYKVLDQITHILHRPQTYVGSNKPNTSVKYIYDSESNKMIQREITYVPSFLKVFDEVITNSIDESKRNKKLNRIDVTVDKETGRITVLDNGGMPIVIHKEHKQYIPEVVFGNLMSGSNYDDSEDRLVAGTNGLGAKLTNVFSTEFRVSSGDGKNEFVQTYSENMRKRTKAKVKKSSKKFTEISYTPDYEKFGFSGMDDDHFSMIEKRIYDLCGCNTNIKIYFNKKLVTYKVFDDYIKLYTDECFAESSKDKLWSVGVGHSLNGFQQVSFANSADTYDGGTHVDYITNQIITQLREFFKKKHKTDIKPSELKQHLFLFINATVYNPAFSSQTKEKLITEVKEFGFTFEISDKMIKSILKSEIVESILDWIERKQIADENKLQREINKKLSKVKVEKLIDAKGKDRWRSSLAIFEGDSANSAFRKYRDPNTMGSFALKGKFINVSEITTRKLVDNKEAFNLMAAIGLSIGEKPTLKDLRYGRILIYTDADCLREDTLVVTKDGDKLISEVDYTDEMLTHTGEYKKVKKIISKDISRYVTITINGSEIVCSEDHKLIVVRDGEVMEVKAIDVKYSDQFLIK
jgi:DNA topoisomerase-2